MLFLKITFHFVIVIFYLSSIHPSVFLKKMSQTGYVLHYQMNLLFVNGKKTQNVQILTARWMLDGHFIFQVLLSDLLETHILKSDEMTFVTASLLPLCDGDQVMLNLGL